MITQTFFWLVVVLAFVAHPFLSAGADASAPSSAKIKQWLSYAKVLDRGILWQANRAQSPEEIDISKVQRIRLKDNEEAFLALVYFPNRGRCCSSGILLVRPGLEEARQVYQDNTIEIDEVIDVDRDGIEEVVMTQSMLAQGVNAGAKTILRFDGWSPVALHRIGFEDNTGACGSELAFAIKHPCHIVEVKWTFVDVNGDGTQDLVECIKSEDGPEPDQLRQTTKVNVYLFRGTEFVPVSPEPR